MQNPQSHIDLYIGTRFAQQGVHFFHSENIEGFRSHCERRHLQCRDILLKHIPDAYTHFSSDEYDQEHGLDERVFGNIYDVGSIYARANFDREDNVAGPYIYGPIIFVFKPEVFRLMSDIVITKSSSFTLRERWRAESVTTEAQVEEILAAERAKDNVADAWQYAEISYANKYIPLEHLEKIIVEPLDINISKNPQVHDRRSLSDIVGVITRRCGISVPIEVRDFEAKPFKPQNKQLLQKLIEHCEQLPPSVTQENWTMSEADLPQDLQDLHPKVKHRMLIWCRYFTFGTLRARHRTAT